jgi:hypothetical protein
MTWKELCAELRRVGVGVGRADEIESLSINAKLEYYREHPPPATVETPRTISRTFPSYSYDYRLSNGAKRSGIILEEFQLPLRWRRGWRPLPPSQWKYL